MHDPRSSDIEVHRIVLIYAVFAGLWILISDQVAEWMFGNGPLLSIVSTLKGWAFVGITSLLLYLLLKRSPSHAGRPHGMVDWKTWQLYLFAVAVSLVTILIREGISASFDNRPLLVLFMLPIILSAVLGGLGPGMTATACSTLYTIWLARFRDSAADTHAYDLFQIGFLVAEGMLVSYLSMMLHSTLRRSESERRRTEVALAEKTRATALLDAIARNSPDSIFVKDLDGRYLLANQTFLKLVGKSEQEMLGQDDTSILLPEQARKMRELDQQLIAEGLNATFEYELTLIGGTRTYQSTKGPLRNPAGKVIGLFGIARDITERKQTEEELRRSEETYRSLFDNMLNSVARVRMVFDGDTPVDYEFLSANPAFYALTGIPESVVGRKVSEVIPGYRDNNPDSLQTFGRVAMTGVPERWEHYLRELDRWFSFSLYSPTKGELVIISDNISDRKRAEEQLRKLSLAVEQSPESILITNLDACIEYVNEAFVQNSGYSREELIGQNPRILQSGRTPQGHYTAMWNSLAEGKVWHGELFNKRKDGSEYIEHAIISPIRQPDGRITHYLGVKEDITERKRAEAEINRLAFYDPLTGLPNRTLLLDRTTQTLATTRRAHHHSVMISLNIDRFKTINDAIGQATGDALLKAVGERLAVILREGDVLARIAGDEFAILLTDLAAQQSAAAHFALHVADKIQGALQEPFLLGAAHTSITASLGLALFPLNREDTPLDILRRANTALHHSKKRGPGQVTFFDHALDEIAKHQFDIERELRQGIPQGELRLYLQPQVDAHGKPVGAEALVRWQHPQRGLMQPNTFIPIAEESNLIIEIDTWVLNETCRLLAQEEIAPLPLRIAVNISPRHFRHPDFVDQIRHTLLNTGADPTHLTLEVTEGMLIDNLKEVIAKMTELSEMGIHFSMDDFGTGYSSLSYLKRLPIHELKIDKSFVQDLTVDPEDDALVETILAVAKLMNLKVVAEGVETEEQAAFLNQRGQVIHQGYLFGKPQLAEALLADFIKTIR